MSKSANFKIIIELEKLKIHVEGAREVAPEIANSVAHQISEVLQPSGYLEAPTDTQHPTISAAVSSTSTRRPRKRVAGKTEKPGETTVTIDWNHDAAKWGTPIQDWKGWQKVLWLLSVIEQATATKDGLTPSELEEIFNRKFRASGLLRRQNIPRDLNVQSNYFGSVDGKWFAKQAGKEEAVKLVAEAKGARVSAATA